MAYSLKVSVTSSTGEDVLNLDLPGGLSAEEVASLSSSMGNVLGSRLPPGKLEQLKEMARTSSASTSTSAGHPSLKVAKEKKRLHTSAKVVTITFYSSISLTTLGGVRGMRHHDVTLVA